MCKYPRSPYGKLKFQESNRKYLKKAFELVLHLKTQKRRLKKNINKGLNPSLQFCQKTEKDKGIDLVYFLEKYKSEMLEI